jgi:cbb3-type cytochrome oxidase maturation protein
VFIVLPLALLIAAAAVVAFIWAVRGGQYDDLDTPSLRVLHDDEPGPAEPPSARADDGPS